MIGRNGYNSRHLVVFQRTSRDPHLAFGSKLGQYLACSMYLADLSRLALDVLVFFQTRTKEFRDDCMVHLSWPRVHFQGMNFCLSPSARGLTFGSSLGEELMHSSLLISLKILGQT